MGGWGRATDELVKGCTAKGSKESSKERAIAICNAGWARIFTCFFLFYECRLERYYSGRPGVPWRSAKVSVFHVAWISPHSIADHPVAPFRSPIPPIPPINMLTADKPTDHLHLLSIIRVRTIAYQPLH